jgi:hypothetical protein
MKIGDWSRVTIRHCDDASYVTFSTEVYTYYISLVDVPYGHCLVARYQARSNGRLRPVHMGDVNEKTWKIIVDRFTDIEILPKELHPGWTR